MVVIFLDFLVLVLGGVVHFSPCLAVDRGSPISGPLSEWTRGNSFVPAVFLNRVHATSIQLYLHHVPLTAFEQRSMEVSLWYRDREQTESGSSSGSFKEETKEGMSVRIGEGSSAAGMPIMRQGEGSEESWVLLDTVNDFLLEEIGTSNFCACYVYVDISPGLFDIRAVLRFGNNETHLKSTQPSVTGALPSFSDEIYVFPTDEKDDSYTISKWINPTSSDRHALELSSLLFGFLDKAEAGTGVVPPSSTAAGQATSASFSTTSTISSSSSSSDIDSSLENTVRRGFSGRKFQHFINSIGSIPGTTYLEVGVYNGSSLISILEGNAIKAVAIDIWDTNNALATAMKEDVMAVVHTKYNQSSSFSSTGHRSSLVHILHANCWTVAPSKVRDLLGGAAVNVYFYDAGHTVSDHFLSFAHFFSAMDDTFIFIVDDWNWAMVRKGTYDAMSMYSIEIVSQIEITTLQSSSVRAKGESGSWHNGMVAFVLKKL